jgi:hypothetical protein
MAPPDGSNNHSTQFDSIKSMKGHSNNVHDHLLEPSVQDQVPVGTRDILESPHVSDGPGKIANSPVPSVFVRIFFVLWVLQSNKQHGMAQSLYIFIVL